MSIHDLVVYPRTGLGKEETGRLRKKGLAPCVVYGLGGESNALAVEPKLVGNVLRSEKGLNTVLNLCLHNTDETRHVIIKSLDRHPVTDRLVHVDFLRINMDKKIQVVVPVSVIGTPKGVVLGGHLTIVRHEVEVECLPQNVPSKLEVDASHLDMNETLRVRDLPAFDGVEYLLGPNRSVAVVHPPEAEVVDSDEEEETGEST